MSFLEINSANPEQKRPFRLSDLQEVWTALSGAFANGGRPLIVSGFVVKDDGYVESGVVQYNDRLYSYYPEEYGYLNDDNADIIFAKVRLADRQIENGDLQPFAFEFVCGTSLEGIRSYAGEIVESFTVANFGFNIEQYRAQVGNGQVTSSKLASSVRPLSINLATPLASSTVNVSVDSLVGSSSVQAVNSANSGGVVHFLCATTESTPIFVPTIVYNSSQSGTSITFDSLNANAITLNSREEAMILFIKVRTGTGYVYRPLFSTTSFSV